MVYPRFANFRQGVRAHRPSELLPAIATIASGMSDEGFDQIWSKLSPWALAAIARESILYGNEHRSAPVTEKALIQLLNLFNLSFDPDPVNEWDSGTALTSITAEQFPYQESIYSELARTHLLLLQTTPRDGALIQAEHWKELLGAPLDQAIGATFILNVLATTQRGVFDPKAIADPDFSEILLMVPRDAIEATLSRLTATIEEAKADSALAPSVPPHLQRFAYNPLAKTPFVDLGQGTLVTPQPRLVLRTITPHGLYYAGVKRWGSTFAKELGERVEDYVGMQLASAGLLEIHGEITYDKGQCKSVDWFVVLPMLVVYVECKSARMTLGARAGDSTLADVLGRYLGKARSQINRSVSLVRERHEAFSHIPSDRQEIGLIVTAEPFYMANSSLMDDRLPDADIPTSTLSLRELEHLLCLPSDEVEDVLRAIVCDPEKSKWPFASALQAVAGESLKGRSNKLLESAWDTYSWAAPDAGLDDSSVALTI